MIAALIYLRVMSVRNWLLSRVRRLRQPKYLVGAIVGAAYFWFFFLRRLVFPAPGFSPGPAQEISAMNEAMPAALILVQVILVMAVGRLIVGWIAPDKPGLAFTEPEIAFLFPAPVSRRMLVHFKLLGSQVTILFSACLLTLLSGGWSMLGGNAVTHAIGWWIIFSTINLHNVAAGFTIGRLVDRGVSPGRRRAVVAAVIAGILLTAAYTVWQTLPPPRETELADPAALFRYLGRLSDAGLLHWVLFPVRLVSAPFFASGGREFLVALGPALAVLGLHYLWVLRAETSFEEASINLAEKRARAVEAVQGGNYRVGGPAKARPGVFPLASSGGRPEIAFLWKNLLSTRGYLNHRTFLVAALAIVGVYGWLQHGDASQRAMLGFIGIISLVVAIYTLLLGPQFARQDLRGDLANIDVLKTYPLKGWQVVLGELLTPTAILTGMIWLGLLAGALGLSGLRLRSALLTPSFRTTAAICLASVTPFVCLLQLMVPNAAMLIFPSWAQATRSRERGIDVMGQRLIFVSGQLLVIAGALLPVGLLGLLSWFAARWVLPETGATVVAAASVLTLLGLEVALGLAWLGRRFERFDLSRESVK